MCDLEIARNTSPCHIISLDARDLKVLLESYGEEIGKIKRMELSYRHGANELRQSLSVMEKQLERWWAKYRMDEVI